MMGLHEYDLNVEHRATPHCCPRLKSEILLKMYEKRAKHTLANEHKDIKL